MRFVIPVTCTNHTINVVNVIFKRVETVTRKQFVNMYNKIGKVIAHDALLSRQILGLRQSGYLEVLATNVAEEARTRDFASLAFAKFAFVANL